MNNLENSLIENLKKHIRIEESMDGSMLSFYADSAKRYVKRKIGYEQEYLEIMVTTIMFEHRLSSADLKEALLALEPIFALEMLTDEPSK